MKLLSLLILVAFIVLRNSFTIFNGKQDRTKVTTFIYAGRKLIEIVICFGVPGLLLLGVIPERTFPILYVLGLLLSIKGLFFMLWTRLSRNKDWGFMVMIRVRHSLLVDHMRTHATHTMQERFW